MNSIEKNLANRTVDSNSKTVVFDFDETLVFSKKMWRQLNKYVMSKLGLPYNSFVLDNMFKLYDKEYIGWGKDLKEQVKIYNNDFVRLVDKNTKNPDFYKLMSFFDNMKEVIKTLFNTNFTIAIATSRDLGSVLEFLAYEDMLKYFDAIRSTEGGFLFKDKPDPYILKVISHDLGISLDNAVMIGDSVVDIEMGKNAGIKTIGAAYSRCTSKPSIAKCKPDYILKTEKDILGLPSVIQKLLKENNR